MSRHRLQLAASQDCPQGLLVARQAEIPAVSARQAVSRRALTSNPRYGDSYFGLDPAPALNSVRPARPTHTATLVRAWRHELRSRSKLKNVASAFARRS